MIVNVREVGYYRVNYDVKNWGLLINQLMEDHTSIDPINRAQILDDALDLSRAGLLNYSISLNTTLYLVKEEDYVPWEAATSSFGFLDVMLRRSPRYGILKVNAINFNQSFHKSNRKYLRLEIYAPSIRTTI